jgi:hypothetical protein
VAAFSLLARSLLRRRWRGYVAIALLVGLAGSVSLAALAGARRTLSAYPRYLDAAGVSDLSVNFGSLDPANPEAVTKSLEGVRSTATYVQLNIGPLTDDGEFDVEAIPFFESVGSLDGRFLVRDRAAIVEGRMPRLDSTEEVLVNQSYSEFYDVHPGKEYAMASAAADPNDDLAGSGFEAGPQKRFRVRVVGVGVLPVEVVQDDVDRVPRMIFPPALTRAHLASGNYAWHGLRLADGVSVAAAKRALDQAAERVGASSLFFQEQQVVTDQVQRSVRPIALSLAVLGGMVALALVVLAGLTISRQFAQEQADGQTLRAMGLSPVTRVAPAAVLAAAAALAGLVLAVIGATLLSPIAPIGAVRAVEPDRGLAFDVTALVGGAGGIALLLSLVVALLSVRAARQRSIDEIPARPSRLAGAATALTAPGTIGVRLAVEPGRGRTAVPVRTNLAAVTVAVAIVVAGLAFATNLNRLIDQPALYGAAWDGVLAADGGYGVVSLEEVDPALEEDAAVEGWSALAFGSLEVDGRQVAAIGLTTVRGDVTPPVLSGRLPRGEDEIVLGRSTLADAGAGLGDRVAVSAGGPERELTVVGTAVLPALGPFFAEHTSPGEGALVTSETMAKLFGDESPPGSVVLLRFRDGRDPARELTRLATALPRTNTITYDTLTQQRPADITNAESMGSAPRTLAAILAVAALVSVALTVAASARRRRGDLALLKAIGFTRRQIASAVAWQTSVTMVFAAVLGSVVGLVLGRVLWRAFADQLAVVPDAPLPVLIAVGVAVGLVVVANVVTAPLARSAARTPTAAVLRSE